MSNKSGVPGIFMHKLMDKLWPICRSITGDGVRQTLSILREQLTSMNIIEVPSGTQCFDWKIPNEWSIKEAYIEDADGNRIVDFADNNLHVVNYSCPVDKELQLDELQEKLHSLPDKPTAVPYVTSYYKEDWGFCLSQQSRDSLKPGKYHIYIDSTLKPGHMTYGEILLPGKSTKEILISTYICHPSMANNELSGPCLTIALARWLETVDRQYSYRIVFIPETIGAIYYISKHLSILKERLIAGFVVTCVGDERAWSMMPSRQGDTLSDRVARHVLSHATPGYKEYSFLERGSDERQYCSPGVNLPVASIMRSKYMTYPEYHTSLDDMELVTPKGLGQSLDVYQKVISVIEANCYPKCNVLCEPKMSERGLRPTIGKVGSARSGKSMMNLLAYADGTHDLVEIAEIIHEPAWVVKEIVDELTRLDLLSTS